MAALLTVAVGASACSTLPDWADPWSSDTPAVQSDSATTPNLADIPDRPAPASTPDEQRQVTDSLAADRAQTNYSAEQLRAGDAAASAPPPAPMSAADQQAAHAALTQPQPPSEAQPAPSSNAAPGDAAPATPSNQSSSAAPATDAMASAAPAEPAAPQEQVADAGPAPQAAQMGPPTGAEPAVPMTSGGSSPAPMRNYAAAVNPSDAALGFKPSTAPPLDPSVSQFVPDPIISRYEQTAAMAGAAASNVAVATNAGAVTRHHARNSRHGVGGPEQMSGAVVANLDALQSSAPAPAAYTPAAGSPAAVVFFPGDGTTLNAEGRAQVRQAVEAFRASGGQGYVRVIGHSSSRTSNMPVEKHLELIFERSKQRADSVARELIRQGIPAAHVLEEAVGDSQPIYYESMPKGEDGNRRAEIFLQT